MLAHARAFLLVVRRSYLSHCNRCYGQIGGAGMSGSSAVSPSVMSLSKQRATLRHPALVELGIVLALGAWVCPPDIHAHTMSLFLASWCNRAGVAGGKVSVDRCVVRGGPNRLLRFWLLLTAPTVTCCCFPPPMPTAATAGFRSATRIDYNPRSFQAEAMFLLTFAASIVSAKTVYRALRPKLFAAPVDGKPCAGLEQTHADGVAVGALCAPIVCAALVSSGAASAERAFWMTTACSLYVLLRRVSMRRGTGLAGVAVWSVLLAAVIGPFGIGRAGTLVVILAFHALSMVLHAGLHMSSGEVCVVGEALVVAVDIALAQASGTTSGLVVAYLCDALALPSVHKRDQVVARLCPCHAASVPNPSDTAIVDAIIVAFVVGSALCGLLLTPFLRKYARRNNVGYGQDTPTPKRVAVCVYGVLLVVTFGVEAPWLFAVLQQNPFAWYVSRCMAVELGGACCLVALH